MHFPAGTPDRPLLVLAHRGLHRDHPANTLGAFAAAVAAGADGIETDIRLTHDQHLVLFHDRIAPNGREVAALRAAELEKAAGYPIPELGRTLELFPSPCWNLEIKTASAAAAALPEIARFAESRRILVSSFWHPLVEEFATLPLETALLLVSHPRDLASLLGLVSGKTQGIVWDYEMLDEDLLAAASARGVWSFAYGMETLDEHERCARLGPSGLRGAITDHPERLLGAPRSTL